MTKEIKISLLTIAASFAAGVYFYPLMPELIASHWGIGGQADDYMPKFWGLFLMPIMSLAIFGLFILLPKIDPMKANYAKFKSYYDRFLLAFVVFMAYIYALTIFWNKGANIDMGRAIIPAMAALFYIVGTVLERAKQNWFIGIRTPWTLSSEKVWDKTNKLGAKLFKTVAIIVLFSILFGEEVFIGTTLLLVAASLCLTLYSYLEFRKEAGHNK
jgi:uncharacterized membrane protein